MCLLNPNSPNPKKSITLLERISENTFKISRKFRTFDYGSVGETVSFEFGPDKKVNRINIGAEYAEPVEF